MCRQQLVGTALVALATADAMEAALEQLEAQKQAPAGSSSASPRSEVLRQTPSRMKMLLESAGIRAWVLVACPALRGLPHGRASVAALLDAVPELMVRRGGHSGRRRLRGCQAVPLAIWCCDPSFWWQGCFTCSMDACLLMLAWPCRSVR